MRAYFLKQISHWNLLGKRWSSICRRKFPLLEKERLQKGHTGSRRLAVIRSICKLLSSFSKSTSASCMGQPIRIHFLANSKDLNTAAWRYHKVYNVFHRITTNATFQTDITEITHLSSFIMKKTYLMSFLMCIFLMVLQNSFCRKCLKAHITF